MAVVTLQAGTVGQHGSSLPLRRGPPESATQRRLPAADDKSTVPRWVPAAAADDPRLRARPARPGLPGTMKDAATCPAALSFCLASTASWPSERASEMRAEAINFSCSGLLWIRPTYLRSFAALGRA
ncbi:uncharacterized protein PFL1_02575 [Pseudozyma flocculosa PF-1]|uniref:Uncharacterized protein n=1 Tax=Pseudozyma flocculosa PF-1 TaxID=1277687 RepID=A0A061HAF9_9BASI|nr:uncharacterized protein PFL1_02575 [Pseudozyma flocculosa PF-1]EPQ29902.1 hypothetical protein PFL1_02575 [Pseudozyma flocculosa PF-1]